MTAIMATATTAMPATTAAPPPVCIRLGFIPHSATSHTLTVTLPSAAPINIHIDPSPLLSMPPPTITLLTRRPPRSSLYITKTRVLIPHSLYHSTPHLPESTFSLVSSQAYTTYLTPVLRFEAELLRDRNRRYSYGLKFHVRDGRTASVLYAPDGIDRRTAETWTGTLGLEGRDRVWATVWDVRPDRGIVRPPGRTSRLDILVMPFKMGCEIFDLTWVNVWVGGAEEKERVWAELVLKGVRVGPPGILLTDIQVGMDLEYFVRELPRAVA